MSNKMAIKTLNQHKAELLFKIKEIIEQYPNVIVEVSTHDGGSVEIIKNDIEFEELEVKLFETD